MPLRLQAARRLLQITRPRERTTRQDSGAVTRVLTATTAIAFVLFRLARKYSRRPSFLR